MATNSYIQRNATRATPAAPASTGKRLMLNILSVTRDKGTPTTDLPIPSKSADKRQLLPLSGERNDFTIKCNFEEEASNIAYDVNTSFVTTPASPTILSIVDQYNYLYDTLLSSPINTKYKLYLDWLGKSYEGSMTISSTAEKDDFTSIVEFSITFKEGGNFLFL